MLVSVLLIQAKWAAPQTVYSVRVTYLLLERSCEVKTINMYQFPVSPVTKQVSIMSYLLSLHHLAQGEAIRRTRV